MEDRLKKQLFEVTSEAAEYCRILEDCRNMDKDEFVESVLARLPRLYIGFSEIGPEESGIIEEPEFFSSYVDEEYYESIRRNIEMLLGPADTFLETFEEDMKYSDTPIASSISECLADIFQPLYNFISVVKDTDGESMTDAFLECRDNFISYWSQTLCNVMRALNHIRYS